MAHIEYQLKCSDCGHEWEEKYEVRPLGESQELYQRLLAIHCPQCPTQSVPHVLSHHFEQGR